MRFYRYLCCILPLVLSGCFQLDSQLPTLSHYELTNLTQGEIKPLKNSQNSKIIGFLGVSVSPKLATNGIVYKDSNLNFSVYVKNLWAQNPDKMINALLLEKSMQKDILLTQSSGNAANIPIARLSVLEFSHDVSKKQVVFRAVGEYSNQKDKIEQININQIVPLNENNVQEAINALNVATNRGLDEFLDWLQTREDTKDNEEL